MKAFVQKFSEIRLGDNAGIGGKAALIGEISSTLKPLGINVPDGFAVNVAAFKYFLEYNKLEPGIQDLLNETSFTSIDGPDHAAEKIRSMIMHSKFPPELESAILSAYNDCFIGKDKSVAVRCSLACEGYPFESFAGLHDSFLNINGPFALIYSVKCCYASLYMDIALKYRNKKGIPHNSVSMCICVQKMVRSDIACSGTGYLAGPVPGSPDTIHIVGSWGLGEFTKHAAVIPDEFRIFQPLNINGQPEIFKQMGSKSRMIVYNENAAGTNSTIDITTPREMRAEYVLSDDELIQLSHWPGIIEQHFGVPMDFEWAKDGNDKSLYLVAARPTVTTSFRPVIFQ